MSEVFDQWNEIKKSINDIEQKIYFKQGEIYFIKIGKNVGYEIDGKGESFLRPVLVFRKLNKDTFIGIPLTSKEKKDTKYYFEFVYKNSLKSIAILSQIRLFDAKRLKYRSGKIKKETFIKLEEKLSEFLRLNITPINGGGYTLQKEEQRTNSSIIAQHNKKVNKVFIVAEAGVNHNGDINLAKKLIDAAVEAGADAVKFQTFKAKNLVSKSAKKADYQVENTGSHESQYEMIKKLELGFDEFGELKNYCDKKEIMFLSTPFDDESIEFLDKLGLEIFKIPSGEITNLPYLRKIGSLKKRMILSTGMANIDEIKDALSVLVKAGAKKEDITMLHANTMYPTPMEDVNLKAMLTIGKTFNVSFGYSDHTMGIEVPIAAVAMGAKVIEKHFTLSRDSEGPDHKASLEPNELKAMVKSIRNIELSLGNGVKQPSISEKPNIEVARKSIVAKRDIKKGEKFTEDNLTVKRPGNGISPMRWDEIVGMVADRDYSEDEMIEI